MDNSLNQVPTVRRRAILLTALAPIVPHILGGVFNVWYNVVIIDPLLLATGLRHAAHLATFEHRTYPTW